MDWGEPEKPKNTILVWLSVCVECFVKSHQKMRKCLFYCFVTLCWGFSEGNWIMDRSIFSIFGICGFVTWHSSHVFIFTLVLLLLFMKKWYQHPDWGKKSIKSTFLSAVCRWQNKLWCSYQVIRLFSAADLNKSRAFLWTEQRQISAGSFAGLF